MPRGGSADLTSWHETCSVYSMTETYQKLLNQHIARIQADVDERDPNNPWHQELNKVDLKNISSLREGRIPEYGDHMDMRSGYPMFEFDDLVQEACLATP